MALNAITYSREANCISCLVDKLFVLLSFSYIGCRWRTTVAVASRIAGRMTTEFKFSVGQAVLIDHHHHHHHHQTE